ALAFTFVIVNVLGFFAGLPLLAALSMGNEVQHRTLPLLLAQPVNRMEIWAEKLGVTVVGVTFAAIVYSIGLPENSGLGLSVGLWVITTIASAMFCTVGARSMVE